MQIVSAADDASIFAQNPDHSGFLAWKQLTTHFGPRAGADRSVMYARVTYPINANGLVVSRPKTLHAARAMQVSESTVSDFAKEFVKIIDEDTIILALKSIMLEARFAEAEVFRGRAFTSFAKMHVAVMEYLEDKNPITMTKAYLYRDWSFEYRFI